MKVYTGKPDRKTKLSHRMPRKSITKRAFKCDGGPYDGATLYLTDGETMIFTANGQTGQYKNGEWKQC
jgi:hypothetical protein